MRQVSLCLIILLLGAVPVAPAHAQDGRTGGSFSDDLGETRARGNIPAHLKDSDRGRDAPITRPLSEAPAREPSLAGLTSTQAAVPNQVCVVFAQGQNIATVEKFAREHDSKVTDHFRTEGLGLYVVLMTVREPKRYKHVLQRMSRDIRPLWVQPNYLIVTQDSTAVTPGSAPVAPQYAIEKMGVPRDENLDGGNGVLVAMIDSGVDVGHESLVASRIETVDLITQGSEPVAERHGTSIASIVVARQRIIGVAPAARLLAIRAFRESDPKSSSAVSDSFLLAKGINFAIGAGAQVINLSIAGPQDRLVEHVVERALFHGIAVIAAGGNQGPAAPAVYPAAQPGVIAVTAIDDRDRLYSEASRGDYISVAAPGVDVIVARPGNGYAYLSGTSIASAQIAGVAALLIARTPNLKPSRLRQVLEATAVDLGSPTHDPDFGAGRVDVGQALARLTELARQ